MNAAARTPKDAATPTDETLNFENAMAELETLVEDMESGELSLEESLQRYEQGIALSRRCKQVLDHAELRLRVLDEKMAEDAEAPAGAGDDKAPLGTDDGDGTEDDMPF